jgi:hypothetical protein
LKRKVARRAHSGGNIPAASADALSGAFSQISMPSNKCTYHGQDLAFTFWFYDQARSTGVNGWYSFLGKLLKPAVPCLNPVFGARTKLMRGRNRLQARRSS